jgi:hypothetical protein
MVRVRRDLRLNAAVQKQDWALCDQKFTRSPGRSSLSPRGTPIRK